MAETPIKKYDWLIYEIDPSVSLSAYADRDLICEKITLNTAVRESACGVIRKVVIIDQAKQSAAINLMFFHTDPSNSTFTENAEFDCDDTDLDNCLGVIAVAGTDYLALKDNSIATVGGANDLYFPIYANPAATDTSTPTSIYMAVLSGGTPDYVVAGDLRIKLWIDRNPNRRMIR